LTENQWKGHLKKISTYSAGFASSSASINTDQLPPDQTIESDETLQVSAISSGITSVPPGALQSVFQKASQLVNDNKVTLVPGSEDKVVVASAANVYIVVKGNGSSVKCDKTKCVGFATYGICSHSVAAAHYLHCLPDFVSFFKKQEVS
jgi:hypothetical protein